MGKKDKKQAKPAPKHEGKASKVPKAQSKTPKSTSEPVLPEIISETIVEYLHEVEGESPIDLSWENFIKIRAVPIEYENYEEQPLTLTIKNTAYNVVMTGTWPEGKKPCVSKGPLANKYEFSQAHFHWGPDSSGGSDHEIEGVSLPFEVHVVFHKSTLPTLAAAKQEVDGVVIFCYLYRLQDSENEVLKSITDNIKEVTYAYSKKDLQPVPLNKLFEPITEDYIVYLGKMIFKSPHGITFIISRQTHFISESQLNVFRELKDRHENPMILKKRDIWGTESRNVFVVNPSSTVLTSVLHSITAKASKASVTHSPKGSSTKSHKNGKKSSVNKKDRSTSKLSTSKAKASKKSRASKKSKSSSSKSKASKGTASAKKITSKKGPGKKK